jgi:hypothetical protein
MVRYLAFVLLAIGCSVQKAAVRPAGALRPPSPAAVSGTYRGTMQYGGTSWTTIWRLQFAGDKVTGTAEWKGPHTRSGVRDPMDGFVDGDRLVVNRDCSGQIDAECVTVFEGTFSDGSVSGHWHQGGMGGAWEVALDAAPQPQTRPTSPAVASALKTKAKMLVMPLHARAGVSVDTVKIVTDSLLGHLDNVALLQTVGRQDLEAVLDVDKQKQALGCDAMSCLAELGGALGADLVCYGDIGKVGATFNINISVVRSSNADVVARVTRALTSSEDTILTSVPNLVEELVRKLNR